MTSRVPVFDPASPQAQAINDLFVQVLLISAGIFMIVAGLICIAIWRFRTNKSLPEQDFGSERKEIAWLVGPVIIVLWIAAISAKLILTLNAVPKAHPTAEGAADLIVTGHQWWWEVQYPGTNIVGANEVHIPINKKLRVKLQSADVIHCFWVPRLARKMDAIPGRENYIWLEADEEGTYQGRCAEFCGHQHAWMNFKVYAHTAERYQKWQQGHEITPPAPTKTPALAGKNLFLTLTCNKCHTIAGTPAHAMIGPDLTHLASRKELGGGVLKNSPENLRAWLKDPQTHKPGCKMPNFKLTDEHLDQLVAYLETCK
ncbi:MAG: cytochrome c oxidase subunit II [Planctomycetaceae bacterium]|nr:cytochrome c oxidase subunit II [Planctomycetaceae bacterium]